MGLAWEKFDAEMFPLFRFWLQERKVRSIFVTDCADASKAAK
jgi:hypothetical protein